MGGSEARSAGRECVREYDEGRRRQGRHSCVFPSFLVAADDDAHIRTLRTLLSPRTDPGFPSGHVRRESANISPSPSQAPAPVPALLPISFLCPGSFPPVAPRIRRLPHLHPPLHLPDPRDISAIKKQTLPYRPLTQTPVFLSRTCLRRVMSLRFCRHSESGLRVCE